MINILYLLHHVSIQPPYFLDIFHKLKISIHFPLDTSACLVFIYFFKGEIYIE